MLDYQLRRVETHMGNRPSYPGTPRWVRAFGIVVIVLIVLVAILLLSGHGPGRHISSGDAGGQVPPSNFMEAHAPPEDYRG